MSAKNSVMVFLQQDEGQIAEVSLELVSKATELAARLNTQVTGVLLGHNIKAKADEVIPYGVHEVIVIENKGLEHYTSVPYTKAMCAAIEAYEPQIVLYGATTTGRDLGPRIASQLKVGLTADCTELEIGDHTIKGEEFKDILYQIRPAFGGNIIATIVSPEKKPQMATVREGVMKMVEKDPKFKGKVTDFKVDITTEDIVTEIVKRVREEKTVNLKGSPIIVAGGAGVGSKENFSLVHDLAKTLGGEVGASRAAVDRGWVDHDHQVGQTGTTVRPKLYIAAGISGSVQHRAGMDESGRIIAINTDPEAPIFKIAHYGIVGDLKEVIPQFIKAFKAKA